MKKEDKLPGAAAIDDWRWLEQIKLQEKIRGLRTELQGWPKVGDKVEFEGITPFWFANIVENGRKLTVGQIYTLSYVQVNSSSCIVKLEEYGEDEFSFGFFKWDFPPPPQERKLEIEKEMQELWEEMHRLKD